MEIQWRQLGSGTEQVAAHASAVLSAAHNLVASVALVAAHNMLEELSLAAVVALAVGYKTGEVAASAAVESIHSVLVAQNRLVFAPSGVRHRPEAPSAANKHKAK